jgi:hypothetical protein
MPADRSSTPANHFPAAVWKRMARLLAAPGRNRIRLWDPDTDKFTGTTRLTETLPARPAAVYLYKNGRTHLLPLDFDTKRYGADAADTDLATAASWITQCGGAIVTDRSSSGGRHLLCPLAIGTSASVAEITQLVRLLAAHLPTLDITPNTNAATGCLTPPGSPCREGGYRRLDGPLDAAIDAFATRSAPDLLPRLYMLMGVLKPGPSQQITPPDATNASPAEYTVGVADDERLAPPFVRDDPIPDLVVDYATRGAITTARPTWHTNHEARMAAVTAAIARGHSLRSIRTMIAPGAPWHNGLGQAYQRYRHHADDALRRDHAKALTWLITNVVKSHPPRHKNKYSQGGKAGSRGPLQLRVWLANAQAWADQEFTGKRYRWTVHAVLQTICFHAMVSGEQRSGSWVVGVGGRALSLATGLLSEDTVWRVLQDLRERPGSPLVLIRQHVGTEADVYALTMQNRVTTDSARAERVRVEPVHDAWSVLGHHLRRVYELVVHHGLTHKADIYAAAAVSRGAGDAMIIDLQIAGLIIRTGWGTVAAGPVELDAIAERERLAETRNHRIQRYRDERAQWRTWLAERERQRSTPLATDAATTDPIPAGARLVADDDHAAWLESVMATGPPPYYTDDHTLEREAIEMIADLLGARIVANG